MTRETKVGLVVATTFLCLVSLTVASKLRGPEASAAVAEVHPQDPGAPDAAKGDSFENSEFHGGKPAPPAPTTPQRPQPLLAINNRTSGDPLPQPFAPAVETASPASGGWWSRHVEEQVNPGIAPLPSDPIALPAPPGGLAPVVQPEAPIQTAQLENAKKLPSINANVSTPPTADPLAIPMPVSGTSKPELGPLAPIAPPTPKKDPVPALPLPDPIVLPTQPPTDRKDPIPAPVPKVVTPGGNDNPLAKPNMPAPIAVPIAPAPAVLPNRGPAPDAVGQKPMMPLADPIVPPVKESSIAPPANPKLPGSGATPKPVSIGTIGGTGNEVPVAPLKTPAIATGSVPALGVGGAVPALPAAGKELPKVIGHSDDVHRIEPSQTTFAQLSQRWYGTDKYADALLEYNRRHLLNRLNTDLQRSPPVLAPNQPIYYPHPNVLESDFAAYIKTPGAPARPGSSGPPVVQLSPPTPLSATGNAAADATVAYRVPQTDHVLRIAQQTLGNMNDWTEIVRLNPSLRTDQPIPAGTVLRLPAKARTN